MKINEIKNDGQNISIIARIEKVIISTATNGLQYMIIHLSDNTSKIEARKWTVSEEDKVLIQPNTFMLLDSAVANEFRNVMQIKINKYTILNENDLSKYDLEISDFFIEAPINIEKEYIELMEILEKVKNDTYRLLTIGMIQKYKDDFLTYPAAMNIHHNVNKGLFWHSYTLVKNCLAIKPNYTYAEIDWDLLICGAILHDIGKVIEIVDVTGIDYSLEGKLLGHISIGNTQLNQLAKDLKLDVDTNNNPNSDLTLLQHMILASHGKKEFGSPVEPALVEAIILSMFDNLDARIYKANEELRKIDVGSWTNKILTEENRMYLKHKK